MTPLERKIRKQINASGPISVSNFMSTAMANPFHGYYQTRDPFGLTGDFITAPEISQVFGEILGLWCAVTWQKGNKPKELNLVELGPGRGTLMSDIMRSGITVPSFLDAVQIHLVETSDVLCKIQRQVLSNFKVHWHKTLDTIPQKPTLIIANEFFDALPVDQYVNTKQGWYERRVDYDEEKNKFFFMPYKKKNSIKIPKQLQNARLGAVFENCPIGQKLADQIGRWICLHGVAAIIIDYGYTALNTLETLQAVKSHRTHNPLLEIGEADLTAHVDFSAISNSLKKGGVKVYGPINQGEFLLSLGIKARIKKLLEGANSKQTESLLEGCRRLTSSSQMGTLFKVIAVLPPNQPAPAGFELQS